MKKTFALTHLYYEDSLENLKEYFLTLEKFDINLFFSVSSIPKNIKLISEIKKTFPNSIIINTPNVGKDVGGKLALIDLCLRLNLKAEYYILLHDKKSPHTTLGDIWREKLFRIIESKNIEVIKSIFNQNPNVGIVASKEFIINEYDRNTKKFNCTSNNILQNLLNSYKLNLNSFDFVGGTMFWIRAEIFDDFFSKNNAIEIRAKLEKGNVLDHDNGTNSHAWERILSWLAIDRGYNLKGI